METRKRRIQGNTPFDPDKPRKAILLDPKPGEIWAALVDDEAIAYGRTRKEAYDKAIELRPDVEPVMFLIAFLWDIGFFDGVQGDNQNGDHASDL